MENLLFSGVPILKHIRVLTVEYVKPSFPSKISTTSVLVTVSSACEVCILDSLDVKKLNILSLTRNNKHLKVTHTLVCANEIFSMQF